MPYVPSSSSKQSRQGGSVLVRFTDPAEPGNAWSGRGRAPRWLIAYEEQGRSREEFRTTPS